MSENGNDSFQSQHDARFQQETKYSAELLRDHTLDWKNIPAPFKEYKDQVARIQLPEPKTFTAKTNIWGLLPQG